MAFMVEHIIKVRIEELGTLRLDFNDGEIREIPASKVAASEYVHGQRTENARHLANLAEAICYFSKKGANPAIEFVVTSDQR